jgi:hypothetical protein
MVSAKFATKVYRHSGQAGDSQRELESRKYNGKLDCRFRGNGEMRHSITL